ncbi:hypothetical protein GOP47_0002962 [Adiantum capillus-veneris]|uniref:Uncharacterized protein n=1 Tax=Adiantum capillus-veneris TaxID=13818 RepID=A0A9D4VBB2_ADICA|nr:hypothetical protein GOP47_0002962 [Adiantum capillus-veneris]
MARLLSVLDSSLFIGEALPPGAIPAESAPPSSPTQWAYTNGRTTSCWGAPLLIQQRHGGAGPVLPSHTLACFTSLQYVHVDNIPRDQYHDRDDRAVRSELHSARLSVSHASHILIYDYVGGSDYYIGRSSLYYIWSLDFTRCVRHGKSKLSKEGYHIA